MCCSIYLPSSEAFLCYRSRTRLEQINDIGQKKPPSIVWHIRGEVAGRLANGKCLHRLVVKRPNVVRLAVVIPYRRSAPVSQRVGFGEKESYMK